MSNTNEFAEIIGDFLVESYEGLEQVDRDLIELEKNSDDAELISRIFRCIHTIKGTCGFLGFSNLESLTHVGENLLCRIRDGKTAITAQIADTLLRLVDAVKEILSAIETTGNETDNDYSELVRELTDLIENAPPNKSQSPHSEITASSIGRSTMLSDDEIENIGLTNNLAESTSLTVSQALKGVGRTVNSLIGDTAATKISDRNRDNAANSVEKSPGIAHNTIRVQVDLLDRLMNMVGELVLSRNQILQYVVTHEDSELASSAQLLNLITTELQEGVMKTRMQPIGSIWNKLPRMIRDLSGQFGKQVHVEMEGKETELDKTIIEAIKDPLMHIIRNSIDHGFENSAQRVAGNKPVAGTLMLRAYHEGGQVNIEIIDDGGGIDIRRVTKKALEGGLLTEDQARRMSERELQMLIFQPGFSTAQQITNVSGRGVGMDVVKNNIEKIGGSVDIQSTVGKGTTLRVKIPLTLAIVPALTVTCAGERFAIPQISLLELVRLNGEDELKQIEYIHGTPVYRLRGNLLPLVYLRDELKLNCRDDGGSGNTVDARSAFIVVVQSDGHPYGLVVDEIRDTQEIVVKPLGKIISEIEAFAGVTIMGDGKVALIVDVAGIARSTRVISHTPEDFVKIRNAKEGADETADVRRMILFDLDDGTPMAIPLSRVTRLEEFKASAVEQVGFQAVVQYRGQILSLYPISDYLNQRNGRSRTDDCKQKKITEILHVIVYQADGYSIGLAVDTIHDIAEEVIQVEGKSTRAGVSGTVVIRNKVREILDVESLLNYGWHNMGEFNTPNDIDIKESKEIGMNEILVPA